MSRPLTFATTLVLAGTGAAQATWHVNGSAAAVRIVGTAPARAAIVMNGPSPQPVEAPAGEYAVHFGVDAAGKPRSLSFAVQDGDDVHVAIERAAGANADVVPDDAWQQFAATDGGPAWTARIAGAADRRACRVAAELTIAAGATAGLVARWTSPTQHYRCVIDAARGELRLERRFGEQMIVLARAPAALRGGDAVELAMQVEGFRIAVFRDDELVLQAFDGAFDRGAVGTWWSGAAADATVRRFTIAAPAAARASAAVVGRSGHAEFHAAAVVPPGGHHALEVALDRPHPPLPLTAAGVEPWLVRDVAAPRVLIADFRQSLGKGVCGEVPVDGVVSAFLGWSDLRIAGQVVLLRSWFFAADGEALVGTSPAAAMRL